VLVHGAAGGVALAAVQALPVLAAAASGASVVATAGSSAKRHPLRSLGCKVAVGSRDTTFATDIALAGGVDVVLNSLTSPGMVVGSHAVLNFKHPAAGCVLCGDWQKGHLGPSSSGRGVSCTTPPCEQ